MTGLILKRASASRLSGEWNDEDVLCEGEVVGRTMKAAATPVGQPWLWTLAYGHHEDHTPTHGYEPTREAAMAIASTPCSPLPANFILLLRWRNTLSSGMLTTRFLFPKFFPKKFGQKIGAGPPTGNFGNGLCAGPVLLHPAPPFVQMKNTPGGPFPRGGFPGAAFGARDRSLGRSIRRWLPISCPVADRPSAACH